MDSETGRRELGRLVLILVGLFLAFWLVLIISVSFEDDAVSAPDFARSVNL